MKALVKLTLVLIVVTLLTGCRCINTARTYDCLFCQPTGQCVKEVVQAPTDWCWGNCQASYEEQIPKVYLPPEAMRP